MHNKNDISRRPGYARPNAASLRNAVPGFAAAVLLPLFLCGCITDRTTDTARSATEQLLLSGAADRAALAASRAMPGGRTVYLDTSDFDATDGKYAIGAFKEALLRRHNRLVDKKDAADVVVEVRSGALATNDHEVLLGIPSITVPVPLSGSISTPKLALYDKTTQLGVAKFAAIAMDAHTGALLAASTPQFGYAHVTKHIVLFVIGWSHADLAPKAQRDPDLP